MEPKNRIIPIITVKNNYLIKTKYFSDFKYIGDPINSVKILSQKEVDELIVINLGEPFSSNIDFLKLLVSECLSPLTIGGGIRTFDDVKNAFDLGVEKVSLNSLFFKNKTIIEKTASIYGKQAVVVSIDISLKNGKYAVKKPDNSWEDLDKVVKEINNLNVGEVLAQNIDRDGTFLGIDKNLAIKLKEELNCPVIISGGLAEEKEIMELQKNKICSIGGSGFFFFLNQDFNSFLINYPQNLTSKQKLS